MLLHALCWPRVSQGMLGGAFLQGWRQIPILTFPSFSGPRLAQERLRDRDH